MEAATPACTARTTECAKRTERTATGRRWRRASVPVRRMTKSAHEVRASASKPRQSALGLERPGCVTGEARALAELVLRLIVCGSRLSTNRSTSRQMPAGNVPDPLLAEASSVRCQCSTSPSSSRRCRRGCAATAPGIRVSRPALPCLGASSSVGRARH